jgi:3-oxoacyl-[acyl-carrier-protein] synthase-1
MASDTSEIVVAGVGMMTAVGLTAAETAASARAATMRFTEIPIRDHNFQPYTFAEVPEDGMPPLADGIAGAGELTAREQRMLRLGTIPLRDVVRQLDAKLGAPGLILSLPQAETTHPIDRAGFLQRLWQQTERCFDLGTSDASLSGRAGGLHAIGYAAELIRAGRARVMVAGGIDTYRDVYVLAMLNLAKRVKSSAHLDGFIPGEGAGFLLLARQSDALAAGLQPLATISPVAAAFEAGHLNSPEPYRGDGLASAIRQLVQAGAVAGPIQEVYSSMNGESHWAKEWGVGFIRNRHVFQPTHGMHHPADSFGDTGAACGPILAGLASLGLRGGYRRGPCLVYSSSDDGPRAALTLTAA